MFFKKAKRIKELEKMLVIAESRGMRASRESTLKQKRLDALEPPLDFRNCSKA